MGNWSRQLREIHTVWVLGVASRKDRMFPVERGPWDYLMQPLILQMRKLKIKCFAQSRLSRGSLRVNQRLRDLFIVLSCLAEKLELDPNSPPAHSRLILSMSLSLDGLLCIESETKQQCSCPLLFSRALSSFRILWFYIIAESLFLKNVA